MAEPVVIGKKPVKRIRVSEIFGPTIQGEGATTGRNSAFVRLSGCNLECSWCDTPYTWDWKGRNGTKYERLEEEIRMEVSSVVAKVLKFNTDNVVITGGEPLTQPGPLVDLLQALVAEGLSVEVETNGTREWPSLAPPQTRWNISPKLSNSGNSPAKRFKPDALASFPHRTTTYKFVVRTANDVLEVVGIAEALGLANSSVYLMPEGKTQKELDQHLPAVMTAALGHGYNVSHRLQVVIWGDKRGH